MELKDVLLKIIGDKISTIENEDVKNALIEYLLKKHKLFLIELSKNKNMNNDIRKNLIIKHCDRIMSLPIAEQQSMLLYDEQMENLINIFNEIYFLAHQKQENSDKTKISTLQYQEYQKKLLDCVKNVETFNRVRANNLLNEALVKLEYIYGNVNIKPLTF